MSSSSGSGSGSVNRTNKNALGLTVIFVLALLAATGTGWAMYGAVGGTSLTGALEQKDVNNKTMNIETHSNDYGLRAVVKASSFEREEEVLMLNETVTTTTSNSSSVPVEKQKQEVRSTTASDALSIPQETFNSAVASFTTNNTAIANEAAAVVATPSSTSTISYKFVKKESVDYTEAWNVCDAGDFCNKFGRHCQQRNPLFSELQELTNFSTTLDLGSSTKLLVLGDSVAMQFFHMLDRASSASARYNRTILEYAFADHISYGISGDGKLGAWRTTGMFLSENEGNPPPNAPDGGWNRTTANALLNLHVVPSGERVGSFDVLLFRIPHGWLELNQIDVRGIVASLKLAHEVFGVTKVILLNLPFSNNVDQSEISSWFKLNDDIQQFVVSFQSNKDMIPGVEGVALMDLAQLTNHFIQRNARHLGYLNGTDDTEHMPYLNVRLVDYIARVNPAAAHVCSGPLFKEKKRLLCPKNAITTDGMHVCPTTYGGRFVAATACLMQCLMATNDSAPSLLGCQKSCNDQYMTLNHYVDLSKIKQDNGTSNLPKRIARGPSKPTKTVEENTGATQKTELRSRIPANPSLPTKPVSSGTDNTSIVPANTTSKSRERSIAFLPTPPSTNNTVSYKFVKKGSVNYTDYWDACDAGRYCNKFGRHCQQRNPLFSELQELTNFSTTLDLGSSTKLLVLGDSVAMQFFHMLDRASSASARYNRTILEYAFGTHLSYGVSGDGKLGAWRTTGMFLPENEGNPPPNEPDGGWNRTTAKELLNIQVVPSGERVGSFDVLLFRIPHGWLELNQIDVEGIIASLKLAHEVFGVTKVILLNLPFVNNVDTPLLLAWFQLNNAIRQFVVSFQSNKDMIPGINGLVLMDLAELTNNFIQRNARHLGYFNGTDDNEHMPYLNVRLVEYFAKVYPAAAHVCSGPMAWENKRLLCPKNSITPDGMHVCATPYGGRFVAATGCLLSCFEASSGNLKKCQDSCNDKYMTLKYYYHL